MIEQTLSIKIHGKHEHLSLYAQHLHELVEQGVLASARTALVAGWFTSTLSISISGSPKVVQSVHDDAIALFGLKK